MPHARLARITATWVAAALALGAVFMLYTQPQLMVTLSEQLWACFN
jgi:HAMP domain-containing protein